MGSISPNTATSTGQNPKRQEQRLDGFALCAPFLTWPCSVNMTKVLKRNYMIKLFKK